MKKIISLLLIAALISGMFVVPVFAEDGTSTDGYYLNEDFENGVGTFSTTDEANVSLSVVPATDVGGTSAMGNVLKFTTANGTNVASYGADVNFSSPIPVDKTLAFETRILAPNRSGSHKYLFGLYDSSSSRSKVYGLARLVVAGGGVNYYSVNSSSDTRWDVSNPLKNEKNEVVTLTEEDWYRIRAIYDNGAISQLSLYDDEGNLIASSTNLPDTQNHAYPPFQIDSIRFSQEGADTIYLDDVKIYEYKTFSVDSSFSGVVSADSTEIEIPFTKELDADTISEVSITSTNAESPEIISRAADGSTLKLTLGSTLTPAAKYTINLTGVAAADGSELLTTSVTVTSPVELPEGTYMDATFDDGINPFSITSGGGSVEIVDAEAEGAGGSGKILKFNSGGASTTSYADATFANPIPLDKPLVFEARFKAMQEEPRHFFRMTDSSTSGTNDGLISFVRPTGAYDLSPTNNGTDFLSGSDGNPILISVDDWYKIKMVYDGRSGGVIASLELYDDNDNLLGSASNLTTSSSDIDQISTVGIWMRDYSTANITYFDDVKIYEYDALAVDSSFSGVLPIDTLEIEIPFNKELDASTLSGVSIIGIDAASPVIVSRAAEGSTLKLTLQDMLIGSASYTVDLSGLKAADGCELLTSTLSIVTPLEEVEGVYLNARFDDNVNPFKITGGAGSVEIVDAATAGAGTSGKVMKFSSGTSRTITFADATFTNAIPIDKPVVFETRFRAPGESHQHLFRLTDSSTNRHKYNGLVRLVRPTGAYDLSVNPSSDDANDAASCLKDASGNPILIDTSKWYRVRAIFEGATNGGTITILELYDSDDKLLGSASNLPTQNALYPITQISTAGFWQRDYGSEDIIYYDDVKIYEYKESDPLTLLGADIAEGAEVSPVKTESITLSFNNRIDITSLNGFVVKAGNEEVNYSAVLVGDSKKVEITFTDGLVGAATYSVDYSGVKDLNGSNGSGVFTFKTQAGLFVKDIVYISDNLTPGATVTGRVNMLNYTGTTQKITVMAVVYEQVGEARKMKNATALIDEQVTDEIDFIDVSVSVPTDIKTDNASAAIIVLEDMNSFQPVEYLSVGHDWREEAEQMIEQWKKEITIDEFGAVRSGCDLYVERLCDLLKMPSESAVKETVRSMENVRPRVIATADTITTIKNKNEFNTQLYAKLKDYADKYENKSVAVPSEFRNNLMFAREVLDRAFVLGFYHRNEGGNYANLLKPQLEEALKLYTTLNLDDSTHVLPYGELTVALCVAYDWIYDALTEEERAEIRDAIKPLAQKCLTFYEAPLSANATQVNNWGAIFNAANIIAGLTMYGEDEDDMWAQLVDKSVRSFTLPLSEFAPNGGFPEGAGYWEYQTQYVVYAMAALESCLGTDFNLSKMPGFDKTVLEPVYLHSNDLVTFDFSDSAEYQGVTAFMNWFGAKFNVPEAFSYSDMVNPGGVDYNSWEGAHYDLMVLFWREDTDPDLWKNLPMSYCFKGRQQVMSIRNSWDKGRAYLAFKGGYNQLPHCNLDIGTFIYDWDGIRWFTELGGEDYDAGGFWDFQGGRWLYYTQRAEGHNTLVVNPDTNADQYIYATATVDMIDATTGVVDITNAYPDLEKGTRTFSLNNDIAVIKDELQLKESGEVYWFMHTKADISLVGDNAAILTKDGSSIRVEFELPAGAELSVMDAEPLLLEYSDSDTRFEGITKLCVKGQCEGNVVLTTRIIPQE